MQKIEKFATHFTAFCLGIVAMASAYQSSDDVIVFSEDKTVLSKARYYDLRLAEQKLKELDVPVDAAIYERNMLSDVVRYHSEHCSEIVKDAKDFGLNWDALRYWCCPDYVHDLTVSVDSLNNWVFCY